MLRTKIYETNLFVGKVRKTSLKMQLLFFLSSRDDFTTSREIATELNIKSPQQAQQLCHELGEDIQEYYPNNEFQLIFSKTQGVRLEQTDGKLQLLLNAYHYSELSYHLLTDLFYSNPISVEAFCEKNFVSEATARRKVRQVNTNLKPFGMHITMGRQLTLVGEEENIRAYYLLTNFLTYQTILNAPITENQQQQMIQKVLTFIEPLNQSYTDFQIEMIALLYGAQRSRIKHGYFLEHRPAVLEHLNEQFFIEKPASLVDWSTDDWDFLLFIMYLFNLYFPKEQQTQHSLFLAFQEELEAWSQTFNFFFKENSQPLPKNVQQDLTRLFYFHSLYPRDVYVFHIFPLLSIEELTERYPLHIKRFEHFFTAFIYKYPHFNTHHFKINSLLLTLALVPVEQRKEVIYIYLECTLSKAYLSHLKISLNERLQQKYHLVFTEHPDAADLTISTMKNFATPTDDNFLAVHPLLFENDYLLIEQAIERFFSYETPDTLSNQIK